jgi:hypothetical protein
MCFDGHQHDRDGVGDGMVRPYAFGFVWGRGGVKPMTRPAYAIAVELAPGSTRIWRAIVRPGGTILSYAGAGFSPFGAALCALKRWKVAERRGECFKAANPPEVIARYLEKIHAI